jgi:hypothetical protein
MARRTNLRNWPCPVELKLSEDDADKWKPFQAVLHYQDDQTAVKTPTHTILGIKVAADR